MIKIHRNVLHLLLLLCISTQAVAATTPSLAALPKQVAIASAAPEATAAGMAILKKGGNAFDAAIAVASVLAVVEPYGSGLGGGGFFLLHIANPLHDDDDDDNDVVPSPDDAINVFIDAREMAPHAASDDMYLDQQGNLIKGASLNGALSAAIPGTVAGLVYLAENYGVLPLSESLQSAIQLARTGFKVSKFYQKLAQKRLAALRASPAATRVFLRHRSVPKIGTVIKQPELANTLQQIAHRGNKGFYQGTIAKKLINGVQQAGGIWTKADLLDYEVIVRRPIVSHYHDMTIIGAPPPSAGGIGIATALNVLSHFDLTKLPNVTRIQVIIETLRRIYYDRFKYLADPAFVSIPTDDLLSEEHADKLRRSITLNKATPSEQLSTQRKGRDTTHFSIMDNQGNWVAATLSLNYWFGSGFMPPGTGVILNDHMDDFTTKPHTANMFGLIGSDANDIAPGKRPLSSMSPTFVITPDKIAVLGTPGGSRIISMVLLGILDMANGNPPRHWVKLPRFHQQYFPDIVQYEKGTWDKKTLSALKNMGYQTTSVDPYGNMQAILWDRQHNQLYAAADPRREGDKHGKAKVMSLP